MSVVKKSGLRALQPSIEFEGPLGVFWSLEDVPIEALAHAVLEIIEETMRRGFSEEFLINLVKKEQGERKKCV